MDSECGAQRPPTLFQIATLCRCKRIPTDATVCPWNNQIYACCPDRSVAERSSALSAACFTLVPPFSKCIDVYEKNGKLTNTIDCAELELLSYPVRVAFSSAEIVFLGM